VPNRNHTINRLFGTGNEPIKSVAPESFSVNGHTVNGKLFPSYKKKTRIKLLEKRLDDLEHQNNHLVNFIQELYKNFPQIISKSQTSINNVSEKHIPAVVAHPKKGKQLTMTKRELEIMRLLIKGLCAKEIANALFISEATVISHKKNLKKKFEARNSVELISKAYGYL